MLGRVDGSSGHPEKAGLGVGQLWSVWGILRGPLLGAWGGSPECVAQKAEAAWRVVLKLGPGALLLGWQGCGDASGGLQPFCLANPLPRL